VGVVAGAGGNVSWLDVSPEQQEVEETSPSLCQCLVQEIKQSEHITVGSIDCTGSIAVKQPKVFLLVRVQWQLLVCSASQLAESVSGGPHRDQTNKKFDVLVIHAGLQSGNLMLQPMLRLR